MKMQSVKRKVRNKNSRLKHFTFLVCIFTLYSLLFAFNSALAQTTCKEVPLPELPGAPDPCSSPAAYITYWFYFSLYLAGIAALLIFVGAGVLRITGGLMPASITKANNLMINAALGLILLFGGWVLLTILDPALTTLRNPPAFFQLQSCYAGFKPSPALKKQETVFSWSLINKDVAKVIRFCSKPTGEEFDRQETGVPAQGQRSYNTFDVLGPSPYTCTVQGTKDDAAKTAIDACSASVSVIVGCELNQHDDGINIFVDWELTIPWDSLGSYPPIIAFSNGGKGIDCTGAGDWKAACKLPKPSTSGSYKLWKKYLPADLEIHLVSDGSVDCKKTISL